MHILIATDGALPVTATAERVARLYEPADSVTVMTAINLPRKLLKDLGEITGGDSGTLQDIVEAAGPGQGGFAGGDRIAEQLKREVTQAWSGDEILQRYYDRVAEQCTRPMVAGLAEAGITARTLVREAEERTAATIIDACKDLKVNLLVIGTTGRGRFEGLLGSTGTKLVRYAPCDILLIRIGN